MIKGAIFDLDGTLLDSMFIWDTIGEEYLRSLGKEPHEDLKETFMTLTLEEAAEYYREHYGVTLSVKEIVDGVNAMVEQTYRTKVTLKPGIAEYLAWLKENGVRMCVATVTDRYLVVETLERLGVRHYFSEIFTCAEVGFGKDKPVIYQKALEHLETEKRDTYVFEDMLFALNTAKTDGFPTVGIYDRHETHTAEDYEISFFEENTSSVKLDLDRTYARFNGVQPSNYYGHSLSVSDVILESHNNDRAYELYPSDSDHLPYPESIIPSFLQATIPLSGSRQ